MNIERNLKILGIAIVTWLIALICYNISSIFYKGFRVLITIQQVFIIKIFLRITDEVNNRLTKFIFIGCAAVFFCSVDLELVEYQKKTNWRKNIKNEVEKI